MDTLQPGDCLLYKPTSLFGWIISYKTWHEISHTEVYIGNGLSIAAREHGVDQYEYRKTGLVHVLRPTRSFDLLSALDWFYVDARGQKYDFLGLLRFAWRKPVSKVMSDNKQFCSELATRFYRHGGLDPFNGEDADAIAPFQFLLSPMFEEVRS